MNIVGIIKDEINNLNNTYRLFHGTSSDKLNEIKTKPTKLFLTVDEDAATYYAAKGGEYYFMRKEREFEEKYGTTPDEYFDTEENGELGMFKNLYPPNATPIVIVFEIPKNNINNIDNFIGYSGGELEVRPEYIKDIIHINWDDLDY